MDKRKLTMVGDTRVGKTALLQKFTKNKCIEIYDSTIGLNFEIKTIKQCKFFLFDISGQEMFENITTSYYKKSDGIIICYDVTDAQSFENVDKWIQKSKSKCSRDTKHFLIALKSDLYRERVISYEQGQTLADNYGMSFFETSIYCDFFNANDSKLVHAFMNKSRDKLLPSQTIFNIPYLVTNCVLEYYSKGRYQFDEHCMNINSMFDSISQNMIDTIPY